jgi:hypothetical protein
MTIGGLAVRSMRRADVGGHAMRAEFLGFGLIEIEGKPYDHDVVVIEGRVRKRDKKPSKRYRDRFGHTPLSADELIPWKGDRLIVGTGASGQLPIMDEVLDEAGRRGIEILAVPTRDACQRLAEVPSEHANAILHVTC